jgi:catechol 2,3-dioxygenase-like lactoylglutathione lyase family enzyme
MKSLMVIAAMFISGMATGLLPAAGTGIRDDPPPAFWHVGLIVSDLITMDLFYGEVIGLQRERQILVEDAQAASGTRGAIVVTQLDTLMAVEGTRIEIRQYSDPGHDKFLELLHYPDHVAESTEHWTNRPLGLSHIGISVASIDSVLARMAQWSLGKLVSGPQRLEEFGGLRYAFLRDPEGNLVELREAGAKPAE